MAQLEEKLRKENVLVTVPIQLASVSPTCKTRVISNATKHYKHELINGHSFSDEENHNF